MTCPASRLLFGSLHAGRGLAGPGSLAVVARVLGRGASGVGPFIAGFLVGDLIWFSAVAAAGLTAAGADTFGAVFVALKYAGAAYLLWLAWKLWTRPAAAVNVDAALDRQGRAASRLFLASLSLTLGNPKVIVFFIALLPSHHRSRRTSAWPRRRDRATDRP